MFTIHIYRRFYDLFAYEADSTAEHIENWESAIMTWEDSLVNIKLLDSWLEEVGVNYEEQ